MKALSVQQPWPALFESGLKTLEIRSWRTNYRGPLLICAGQRPSNHLDAGHWPERDTAPRGVTICMVELVDCRLAVPDDHKAACLPSLRHTALAEADWAWVTRFTRSVPRIPLKGRLGLFAPPPATLEDIGVKP